MTQGQQSLTVAVVAAGAVDLLQLAAASYCTIVDKNRKTYKRRWDSVRRQLQTRSWDSPFGGKRGRRRRCRTRQTEEAVVG